MKEFFLNKLTPVANFMALLNLFIMGHGIYNALTAKTKTEMFGAFAIAALNFWVFLTVFNDGFFIRYFRNIYQLFKAQWNFEKWCDGQTINRDKLIKEEIERLTK